MAWSGLRARPLPAGDPSQDAACGLGPVAQPPRLFPVLGMGCAGCSVYGGWGKDCGGAWSLAVGPAHPLSAGAVGPEGAWPWVEASPYPTLSQAGVKSPGLSRADRASKAGI